MEVAPPPPTTTLAVERTRIVAENEREVHSKEHGIQSLARPSTAAEISTLALAGELSVTKYPPYLAEKLSTVRSAVDAAIAKEPSLAPAAGVASDALVRFLIANKMDAAQAAAEYEEALRVRQATGLDAIQREIVERNPGFFGGGSATLDTIFFCESDAEVDAAHPRSITSPATGSGPYTPLVDRKGNLVSIEAVGGIDHAGVVAAGTDKWERRSLYLIELKQLIMNEFSRRSGVLRLTCNVVDMTGASLMPNPFPSKAEKSVKAANKAFGAKAQLCFPTTTYKTYLINIPDSVASMAGPAIKAVVPARSASKLKVMGHDYRAALHSDVEPAHLPRRLGGTLDDGIQWAHVKKKKS